MVQRPHFLKAKKEERSLGIEQENRVVRKGNYRQTEVTLCNWRERNVYNTAMTHYGIHWYANTQQQVHMWN